jgi:hypothetical protein
MVEGERRTRRRKNIGRNRLGIRQNSRCRNTQDANAMGPQPLIANRIAHGVVGPVMCSAIHFDGQPRGNTEEIGDIWPEWMLAAELHAIGLPAKSLPQQHFGITQRAA